MNYRVIASGSSGNCVIYKDIVMIDLGIKLKDKELITPYLDSLKVIIISHRHQDHIQIPLMKWIVENYPNIMFVYGNDVKEFVEEKLVKKVKGENVQIEVPRSMEIVSNKSYTFRNKKDEQKGFTLKAVDVYHDVPNFALYIRFNDDYKVFHATDTYTLDLIKIPSDTDLVAIEHHHITEHYNELIEQKQLDGEYSHEYGAKNVHLSFEDAEEFLKRNKLYGSEVLRLHTSSHEYYKDIELSYIYEGDNKNED